MRFQPFPKTHSYKTLTHIYSYNIYTHFSQLYYNNVIYTNDITEYFMLHQIHIQIHIHKYLQFQNLFVSSRYLCTASKMLLFSKSDFSSSPYSMVSKVTVVMLLISLSISNLSALYKLHCKK